MPIFLRRLLRCGLLNRYHQFHDGAVTYEVRLYQGGIALDALPTRETVWTHPTDLASDAQKAFDYLALRLDDVPTGTQLVVWKQRAKTWLELIDADGRRPDKSLAWRSFAATARIYLTPEEFPCV